VLGGPLHDDLPDAGAAGEEDVIDGQVEQYVVGAAHPVRRADVTVVEDRDLPLVEHRADDLLDHIAGRRRHGAGLGQHHVSRGDRLDQGGEEHPDREVPGAEEQHHAAGLVRDEDAFRGGRGR
jgi:hypothetical protein